MKIQSSAITMSGKSSFIQQYSKDESLKYWVGKRPDFENKIPIQKNLLYYNWIF